MAKRHKGEEQEESEDYEFIPADFDEDQFIHKEMVSFHTTTVLFFTGIVAALVSWGLFAALDGDKTGWLVGLLIMGVFFAALRPIFRVLSIDISHWARREWIGTAFLMFFAWLAFFIMFVNPPISDFAAPDVIVYTSPAGAGAGDDVVLDIFFADNHKVTDFDFRITGPATATTADLTHLGGAHHRYRLDDAAQGEYTWSATATDPKGQSTDATGTFTVAASSLIVDVGDLTTPTGIVFVRTPEGVDPWAVYAQLDTGGRVYFEEDEALGGWKATANFAGWTAGTNNATIHAEEHNRFQGQTLVRGGILSDGPHTIEVANPGDYSKSIPKRDNNETPPNRAVPGLEVPLLLAGLVAAVVIKRRS